MPTLIKIFPDDSQLEFDKGKFDGWCVYFKPANLPRYAPKDVEYFDQLARIAEKHGADKVYNDFINIFNRTSAQLSPSLLEDISTFSKKYVPDHEALEKLMTILYAGMVAEENKANTKLGKKIKRLGVYQVLREQMKPEDAAVFSKGMTWQQILREYDKRIEHDRPSRIVLP